MADEAAGPVTLRPFTRSDLPVAAAWGLDAELCRQAEWTPGLPLEDHLRHWQALLDSPSAELIRLAAVAGDTVVGYVDLHGTDPRRRELGYVIGRRDLWGRGLGTQAARAGLAVAFDDLGLEIVVGQAMDANPGSVRILQRLNMIETGRGEQVEWLDRPTHYRRFMITREAWSAQS